MKKFNIVECASLGVKLPECIATEVDAIVKGNPGDCKTLHTKAHVPDEIWFQPNERAEVSILTTATVDKSNEVVQPDKVELDIYRKSMAVFWNHCRELPPVATCQWIKHHQQDNSLRGKTLYPAKPDGIDGDWFTEQVWGLTTCKPPVLRAKSIGFLPRKPLRSPTADELTNHPDWQGAGIWDEVVMVEYSCVSIGCNNDALLVAVNNKSVDAEALVKLGLVPEAPPADHTWIDEAIAQAMVYGKVYRKPKKKRPDQNFILGKALEQITIDPERILAKALQLYENRGKV